MAVKKSTSVKALPKLPKIPAEIERRLDVKLSAVAYSLACMRSMGDEGFPDYKRGIDKLSFAEITIQAICEKAGKDIADAMLLLGMDPPGDCVGVKNLDVVGVSHE